MYYLFSDGAFYWGDGTYEIPSGNSFSDLPNTHGHNPDCDESLSVRSTALALMVYTERGEYMTEPIVRWLNSRRKLGWDSTIDTSNENTCYLRIPMIYFHSSKFLLSIPIFAIHLYSSSRN